MAAETQSTVNKIIDSIYEELDYQLMESCEELDGYWVATGDVMQEELSGKLLSAFYANNFGGRTGDTETSYGRCVENDTMVQCISYNSGKEEQVATYDRSKDICIFTDEWYKMKCETMQGNYKTAPSGDWGGGRWVMCGQHSLGANNACIGATQNCASRSMFARNYTDEWAVQMLVAMKVTKTGAMFCPVQVEGKNKNKGNAWTEYASAGSNSLRCLGCKHRRQRRHVWL